MALELLEPTERKSSGRKFQFTSVTNSYHNDWTFTACCNSSYLSRVTDTIDIPGHHSPEEPEANS